MDALGVLTSICILLASVETLQGIIRAKYIVPRIGKQRALQLSAVTGSVFAFLICYMMVPRLTLSKPVDLLFVGVVLSAFMALFDIFIGRVVMKMKWSKVLHDFNPASGNLLSLVLVLLIFYPYFVVNL